MTSTPVHQDKGELETSSFVDVYPLVICYIALENGPVEIVSVPIEHRNVPQFPVIVYQRVSSINLIISNYILYPTISQYIPPLYPIIYHYIISHHIPLYTILYQPDSTELLCPLIKPAVKTTDVLPVEQPRPPLSSGEWRER